LTWVYINNAPLRERLSDIALLANHFLAEFARKSHQPSQGLLPCALQKLLSYQWPGNIRELANVIAESLLLCDEPSLSASQILIREWAAPSPTGSLKEQKNEVDAQF